VNAPCRPLIIEIKLDAAVGTAQMSNGDILLGGLKEVMAKIKRKRV
jgi:hypothetical protein